MDEDKAVAVPLAKSPIPSTLAAAMGWEGASCYDRKVAIRVNFLYGAESMLIVGCLLAKIYDSEEWRNDGSEATKWTVWVEHEMGIKKSTAGRMLRVWRAISPYLPQERDTILQIDFSKLVSILPVLNRTQDKAHVIEWFNQAKELTCAALDNQVKEYFGKQPTDTCGHMQTEAWEKCTECGMFLRIAR
jgi:hypothetical protein